MYSKTIFTHLVIYILIVFSLYSVQSIRNPVIDGLLDDYDRRVGPHNFTGSPVISTVQIYIISIDSISDQTMDYSMSMFIRQRWIDPRLKHSKIDGKSFIELDTTVMDAVWIPDLYILNEKSASHHDVTVPNKLMHIYPDGLVVYSARVSGTFSCAMLLHKYPLDTQQCSFVMESYGYSVDTLLLRWNTVPVERSPILSLPQFQLGEIASYTCDKEYAGVNYTCIGMDFDLVRNYGYYMIQVYVPSFLTVLLSWVSFWIDIDATPARTSLGLLTVLTITTQSSASQPSFPRVSYIKAIDVWDAMCLIFVFSAFIEYAWVNVLARVAQRKRNSSTMDLKTPELEENGNAIKQNELNVKRKGITHLKDLARREKARTVDKVSRVVFPLAFILFNLAYWFFYILWKPH